MMNYAGLGKKNWYSLMILSSVIGLWLYGCKEHRLLTQEEIMRQWVARSGMRLVADSAELMQPLSVWNTQHRSPDMVLVSKGSAVSVDEIDDKLCQYAGGRYQGLWLYTFPDVSYDCYINTAIGFAFPISSLGVSLEIEYLSSSPVRAEDIYLAEGADAYHYDMAHLDSIGWRKTGKNKFVFNFPANTTGRVRFWEVHIYNADPAIDESSNWFAQWMHGIDATGRHPLRAPLCFVQVTYNVYPEKLYTMANLNFLAIRQSADKYEGRPPEVDMIDFKNLRKDYSDKFPKYVPEEEEEYLGY